MGHRLFRCGALAAVLCASATLVGRAAPLTASEAREHAARRAAVRRAAGGAVVLLRAPAEDALERTRYRTDNNVMYLTGVEAPNIVLALFPDGDPSGRTEVLYVPSGTARQFGWPTGGRGLAEAGSTATGIAAVEPYSAMWEQLAQSVRGVGVVYVGGAAAEGGRGQTLADRVLDLKPEVKVLPAGTLVRPLRWVKSPSEVARLRKAVYATVVGMRAAAAAIRPGVKELAVEGAILAGFRRAGANREGFPCIVGAGPNSVDLHHFAADRVLQNGDTVVVDIGAEWRYYSADLTRTFPAGGRFTPRQKALYQLVLDTQKACERAFVPGETTLADLNRRALDFLRASPLRARDRRGTEQKMDAFMVHAVGHSLGMDVHDVTAPGGLLVPGCVFTLEPGVYIEGEGIGIRIEDDYLVTEKGLEKLSKALPSAVADIERMMVGPRGSRGFTPPAAADAGRTARSSRRTP